LERGEKIGDNRAQKGECKGEVFPLSSSFQPQPQPQPIIILLHAQHLHSSSVSILVLYLLDRIASDVAFTSSDTVSVPVKIW
jgi:hypothetical protein